MIEEENIQQDKTTNAGRRPASGLFEDGTYSLEEFHRVFIECEDPSEYQPALQLVGDWEEWCRLKKYCKDLREGIERWQIELEVKLRSKAIKKLCHFAKGGDNLAFQAAKLLFESGGTPKASKPNGNTKAQKRREEEVAQRTAAETEAEIKRIEKVLEFKVVNKNG